MPLRGTSESRRLAAELASIPLDDVHARNEALRRGTVSIDVNGRQDTTRILTEQVVIPSEQETRYRLLLGRALGDLDEALCHGSDVVGEWEQIASVAFERLAFEKRMEAEG